MKKSISLNICVLDDCERSRYGHGYCQLHYQRNKRNGNPLIAQRNYQKGTKHERFLKHIDKTDTCWLWSGAKSSRNYGHFTYKKERSLAHRYSYEFFKGNIPWGYEVDHICRNPACVNPAHLRLATHNLNSQNQNSRKGTSIYRGVYWDKAKCKWAARGHLNYKGYFLGRFDSELDAHRVAQEWRRNNLPFSII